jgi:LPS export ABC transporter protein LptC
MRLLLVLAAACALSLAACQEGKTPPVAAGETVVDSADQVLYGVRTNLTNAGLMRGVLLADTALMYDDNTRTELRTLHTTFYTQTGAPNGTLTAERGTYNIRLGSMEARGNVVVVSTDGRRLVTPHLRYDPTRNEISGDSAFVLTEPTRTVEGIGFVSDPNMNNVRILRGSKYTGGSVPLPKS